MNRTATLLPALMMLPWLSGCLFTVPMWNAANERVAAEPVPLGVLASSATDAPALLVVEYSIPSGGGSVYATVPLDACDAPTEPFGYAGTKRTGAEIAAELSPEQLRRMLATRFAFHDEKWARRLESNPRFRERDWTTDGMSPPFDADFDPPPRVPPKCGAGGEPDVRVRALRLGRPWTDTESEGMSPMREGPDVYPTDTHVLILPYARPRPAGHRLAAQVSAVLWTPVALIGDAVGVPYLYIMCYGFGACP